MKRLTWRQTLLLALVVLLLTGCGSDTKSPSEPTATIMLPPPTIASEDILIVTGEWPPFASETMDGGGLGVEIVNAVFAEMGRPVRIEFYPWERCETMVESGEAWAAFPYVPTPDRQERFLISDTMFYGREMWFYFGDNMKDVQYEELADLQPYRIGVGLGYWYIDSFEQAGLTMDEGNDELANLRKLHAGRIDLFPVNEYVARWLIQANFPGEEESFGMLDTPLRVNDNILIVSQAYPDSQALLEQFNSAFDQIQQNGAYQQIFEKYQLQPISLESTDAN
jgi:polar amino acid transport system substrate-binding protein